MKMKFQNDKKYSIKSLKKLNEVKKQQKRILKFQYIHYIDCHKK